MLLETRFLSKVKKTGSCWLWIGSKTSLGYGRLFPSLQAHRVAYSLYVGAIPKGSCVLHRCDVRSCVNPGHLFLGTQLENIYDMVRKGRHHHGDSHRASILTKANVIAAKQARAMGARVADLCEKYKVSESAMRHALSGRHWKEVSLAV